MSKISNAANQIPTATQTATEFLFGKPCEVEDIFSLHPMSLPLDVELALTDKTLHGSFIVPVVADVQLKRHRTKSWNFSLATLISVLGVCSLLLVLKGYVRVLLLWIELQDTWLSFGIFLALFLLVSFPFTWGYVVLNITTGYLFGFVQGVLVTSTSATYGIFVSHVIIRRFFSNCVKSRLTNASMDAVLRVLEGRSGCGIVVLTRLTPIPFGLQNALFSVSNIAMWKYMVASVAGLLPTQMINTYIGSTLRSMEDVLSNQTTSYTSYYIVAAQLVATAVMIMVMMKAARVNINMVFKDLKHKDCSNRKCMLVM